MGHGLPEGKNLTRILRALEDDKPTNLRQFISVLSPVLQYKPELRGALREKVSSLSLSRYSSSMQPLLRKDIQDFLSGTEEE